ncbi:hypothetical protein TRVL_05816 [Trypanosoma vivax]|nr:hypothetical protein TRVL_05816 [Trypanosoma vivax]
MSSEADMSIGVVDRQREPKRRRRTGRLIFRNVELHRRFEGHVARAQELFLRDDKDGAEREATMALRIHPTDHLFALLAVIAESKGQLDRASDFRLLQAFLANDVVLWEELLHEFLQERLYYKSTVCLQRLSALETKDGNRYRTLQLQLADLYIGLGEIKRAIHILVSLWNSSRCRDFEVFALLSSLFFQLGRWNSLHRLIVSSLKSSFRPIGNALGVSDKTLGVSSTNPTEGTELAVVDEGLGGDQKRRISKRVRFLSAMDNCEGQKTQQVVENKQVCESHQATAMEAVAVGDTSGDDDFDFTNVVAPRQGCGTSSNAASTSSAIVSSLYGNSIELATPQAKKNFLTLVNVHAELLNEEGNFLDTVRLMEFVAGCLEVALLELPPDLLVRLGVAYAFLGGMEQQCREVFEHLINTCPMAEYGDVLYDAANALRQVGMHTEAKKIFKTLRLYHEFRMAKDRDENGASVDAEEMAEIQTVFVAALFAEGQCEASLGNFQEARESFSRVLKVESSHLQSRLALGRLYMYEFKDSGAAIGVLTPREDESPLERIQLAAELVRVFARLEKHIEAIALGVSVFELILSGDDEGDTESVAVGSTRRSTAPLLMPTLSPASSAIIPPSAISDIVNGRRIESGGLSAGRLSHTLATSIRASSAVFRTSLARRGSAPLTASIYGASAAVSTAAGYSRAEEQERFKDTSTIFRFNRRRGLPKRPRSADMDSAHVHSGEGDAAAKKDCDSLRLSRKRRRMEEATHREAESFWSRHEVQNTEEDDTNEKPSAEIVKANESASAHHEMKASDDGLGGAAQEDGGDNDESLEQYELPSLEDVSKQFDDPVMQKLFLQASSNEMPTKIRHPWEAVADMGVNRAIGTPAAEAGLGSSPTPHALRVTIRDALSVLGRVGLIELASIVIECYSKIGKFTEAKEFAFLILSRCRRTNVFRYVGTLERPLRWAVLRAALVSGEGEDAIRVGIRLLREQCAEEEKDRVMELLFGLVNRVDDGTSILLRTVVDRQQVDLPLLVLIGNRYFLHRSYIRALNMYLIALQKRPEDIFLSFIVGLSYILISHQKKIRARNNCVVAGFHYISKYREALQSLDPRRLAEATYNCARAFQYLGIHHLAVPLYEQVAYEYTVPDQCTIALQRAARWNLYFTYRWRTGNPALALNALLPRK